MHLPPCISHGTCVLGCRAAHQSGGTCMYLHGSRQQWEHSGAVVCSRHSACVLGGRAAYQGVVAPAQQQAAGWVNSCPALCSKQGVSESWVVTAVSGFAPAYQQEARHAILCAAPCCRKAHVRWESQGCPARFWHLHKQQTAWSVRVGAAPS